MFPFLTSFFGFFEAALNFVSESKRTELSRKYYELKTNIQNENFKPVDQQDHASLEKWYQQIPILMEVITLELKIAANTPHP